MRIVSLTLKSMANRKFTLGLTLLSVAISVMLLLGVERMQYQLRQSFTQTLSGTDVIVGPRSGQLNLLLYSVFGLGEPGNTLSANSWHAIAARDDVAWTVPIALGDSHQGFQVIGTNQDYFRYRKYAQQQSLAFETGHGFENAWQLVLGADVAKSLNYKVGQTLVLSHGVSKVNFHQHKGHPLKVVGILKPTGTPVDQRLLVDLDALAHMHESMQQGQQPEEFSLSALYVGAKSKPQILTLLRDLNEYQAEALTAILPLVAMDELWSIMGSVQAGLMLLAAIVVVSTLLSLLTNMLTSLSQRQREMAILRSLGASPRHIFELLLLESLLIGLGGIVLGLGLLYLLQWLGAPLIQASLGLQLSIDAPQASEYYLLGSVLLAALLVSLVPAIRAFRMTLHQGMQMRV